MFKRMNEATAKPNVWSQYTADVLWTDRHIAQNMLECHLNPDLNLASRTAAFINDSVAWLMQEFLLDDSSQVIDFGCGPGLYTYRLKAKGIGTVTLDQYVIVEEGKTWNVYNWLQHFSVERLSEELEAAGLEIKKQFSDLKGTPFSDGDEMAFVIGHK